MNLYNCTIRSNKFCPIHIYRSFESTKIYRLYPPPFEDILILIILIPTLHRKFIEFVRFSNSIVVESILFLRTTLSFSLETLEHRLNVEIRAVITHRGTPCIFSGQLAEQPRFGHASPQRRCPTRGSSEIQISHARHFSFSLSLPLSSQRPLDLEDDARTTVEPDFSTGASFISRFHPLI